MSAPLIVVTGATGLVGRMLVRQARAGGYLVRAVARDLERARRCAELRGAELFHGNALCAPSLEGAMDGAGCVVNLVGIVRQWRENTFERAHVDGAQNVLDAAKKAGAKRFVHVSALGARDGARSRYHQSKWAGEERVRKSGLAWTILRPSVIYGAGDRSISVLAKTMRLLPVVPVLGDGRAKVQPVAVEFVAGAVLGALRNDNAVGKTYDLCGPEAFSWNELYDKLMKAQGLRKPKAHLPLPVAHVLAGVFEALLANPPFTRDQLLLLSEDNVGDARPAEHDFVLEQESFEAGISRYLARRQ
jgi:NADH dehydrogenase